VRVVAIDLTTLQPVGGATLAGAPSALAVSADGARLYAARPGAIDVIDPTTFAVLGSIRLPRRSNPTSLAVSGDGSRAAAAIDRRHVAIVSLERGTIVKRVEVTSPGAVAFAPGQDDVWVASPAR
jgi:DNA-binding beta-propeller fold protein YncE